MKNRQILTGLEFREWIPSQLTFDFSSNDIVDNLIANVSKYPVAIYEPEFIERAQFSAWWRHLQVREYENPYIQDVYYLHELMHMSLIQNNLPHFNMNESYIKEIMVNELCASIFSEVTIYVLYPELRAKTFTQEIWGDRYLKSNVHYDVEKVKVDRLMAMLYPSETTEYEIAKYATQNVEWAEIWQSKIKPINTALVEFFEYKDMNSLINFVDRYSEATVAFPRETFKFHMYLKDTIKTLHKV